MLLLGHAMQQRVKKYVNNIVLSILEAESFNFQ